jgi:flagellar FliJ protein
MTQALHTLYEHAQRLRDESRAALQRGEAAAERLQVQAGHLQAYRDQTQQRSPLQGGGSAPIDVVRGHLIFMERLELARAQQQAQLQAELARCATLRAALLACEMRVASVRKLLERRGVEAQRRTERQDQRRSDESAQRAYSGSQPPMALWNRGAEAQASTY